MKVLGILILGFFVIVGGLGIWGYLLWDSETLRYRLTYEVVVGEEVKTGSAIVQIRWEDTTKLPLPNTGVGHKVTGEAVVVDLGGGKYLFSLLKGQTSKTKPNELVQLAFGLSEGVYRDLSLLDSVRKLKQTSPTATLYNSQLPLLVMFTDINDPASIKKVNPGDLAASFGPGVKLKAVTLAVTDEPVTTGEVEKVLGWIDTIKGRIKTYSGPTRNLGDVPAVELLNRLDFVRK